MPDHVVTVPIDPGKDLEPFDLEACQHMSFAATCNVTRVCHEDGQAPHTFDLEVSVFCTNCGERMRFRGAKHAITFREPSCSIFALSLCAPMEPSGHYITADQRE